MNFVAGNRTCGQAKTRVGRTIDCLFNINRGITMHGDGDAVAVLTLPITRNIGGVQHIPRVTVIRHASRDSELPLLLRVQ